MEHQAADSKVQELENVKMRLQAIDEEAAALRERKAKLENEISRARGDSAEKEEVDSRSVYVANVDYACQPEEVQQHFQACGTVNRVTIMTDDYGQPKGFAYVEFEKTEAVQAALLLNKTELRGRQLKVCAKRTNIPGMKQYGGRRPNPYFKAWKPYIPEQLFSSPYGYGNVHMFRRPNRYRPY